MIISFLIAHELNEVVLEAYPKMKNLIIGITSISILSSFAFFLSGREKVSLDIRVPYETQIRSDACTAASLKMVFAYWGKSIDQNIIYAEIMKEKPAILTGMVKYAKNQGYLTFIYYGSVNDIKIQLRKGFPLIVFQKKAEVLMLGL